MRELGRSMLRNGGRRTHLWLAHECMRALNDDELIHDIPQLPQPNLQQVQLRTKQHRINQIPRIHTRRRRPLLVPSMPLTRRQIVRRQALSMQMGQKHSWVGWLIPKRSSRVAERVLYRVAIPVDEEEDNGDEDERDEDPHVEVAAGHCGGGERELGRVSV